ncbi:MAG TPA: DHA2 family efflux MFS transporter permease subunit, partial [Stellaceae bacterium]|nr:DHA2 family efflux MFS transporter permease subunit [Stellaceae bacterium]
GFTVASALCGAATTLIQLVLYRVLQGMCGAALVPLSQSVLLRANPPERHGRAMAIWGIGTMLGPIVGPALGGWLTDNFTWRWVFLINLPVGVLCALGILVFIHDDRRGHRDRFDFFGFGTLSLAVGAVQMMLDRGELKDWFGSSEIWIEATVAALCLYLFVVHTATTSASSFLNRAMLKDPNFTAGIILMFFVGIILNGTMVLLPTMMQVLMNYPVVTAGFVMAPRGIGTLISMILVARIIGKIDTRLIIFTGLALTAASLWQMTGFSLYMDMNLLLISGTLQGIGLGFVFTPLSVAAFSTMSRQHLTQGTAIFSLMRNIGGSVGVSIVEALFVENTQVIHSSLIQHVRPDNPFARAPYLMPPYDLTTATGVAAINAEVTRQAQMIAYINDFYFMAVVILATLPLLLLLRRPRVVAKGPAVAME